MNIKYFLISGLFLFQLPLQAQDNFSSIKEWIAAIEDTNRITRFNAAYAYTEVIEDSIFVAETLINALGSVDPFVRQYAANAIGEHQLVPELTIPELIKLLKDSVDEVRNYASLSLTKIGSPAIPTLIKVVEAGEGPFWPEDSSSRFFYEKMSKPAIMAAITLAEIRKGVDDSLFMAFNHKTKYAEIAFDLNNGRKSYGYLGREEIILPPDSSLLSSLKEYKIAYLNCKNNSGISINSELLRKGLNGENRQISNYVYQLLIKLDTIGEQIIGDGLINGRPQIRKLIIRNLFHRDIDYSFNELDLLKDPYRYSRMYRFYSSSFSHYLVKALKDSIPEIRFYSLLILNKYFPPHATIESCFIKSLKDSIPEIRLYSLRALNRYFPSNTSIESCFLEALKESPERIKSQYLKKFAEFRQISLKSIEIQTFIHKSLKDTSILVRETIFKDLGKFSNYDTSLKSYIIEGLFDEDPTIQYLTSKALFDMDSLSPEVVNAVLLALQKSSSQKVLLNLLHALNQWGDTFSKAQILLPYLGPLTQHSDWKVRRETYKILGNLSHYSNEAKNLFLDGLYDPKTRLRKGLVYMVTHTMELDTLLVNTLFDLLQKETNGQVQRFIINGLRNWNDSSKYSVWFYEKLKAVNNLESNPTRKEIYRGFFYFHPNGEKLDSIIIKAINDTSLVVRKQILGDIHQYHYRPYYYRDNKNDSLNVKDEFLAKQLIKILNQEKDQNLLEYAISLLIKTGEKGQYIDILEELLIKEIQYATLVNSYSTDYRKYEFRISVIFVLFESLAESGEKGLNIVKSYFHHPNPNYRYASIKLLRKYSKIEKIDSYSLLLRLLDDDDDIQEEAIKLFEIKFKNETPLSLHEIKALIYLLTSKKYNTEDGYRFSYLQYYFKETVKDILKKEWSRIGPIVLDYYSSTNDPYIKASLLPWLTDEHRKWDKKIQDFIKEGLNSNNTELKHAALDGLKIFLGKRNTRQKKDLKKELANIYESELKLSLADSSVEIRLTALEVLNTLDSSAYIFTPQILNLSTDSSSSIQYEFIQLGKIFFPQDTSYWLVLIKCISADNSNLKYISKKILNDYLKTYPSIIDFLKRSLINDNPKIRENTAEFLFKKGYLEKNTSKLIAKLIHDRNINLFFLESVKEIRSEYFIDYSRRRVERENASTRGFARMRSGVEEEYFPTLPIWPPPLATTRDVISKELLGNENDSLKTVFKNLSDVLDASGFKENRFFSLDKGFAVLTKLERINDDVSPYKTEDRWTQKELKPLDFSDYLTTIFMGTKGNYRVMLFVITSLDHFEESPDKEAIPRGSDFQATYRTGRVSLEKKYFTQRFKDKYVHCLIYQFEKRNGGETLLIRESPYAVGEHLEKAGFNRMLKLQADKKK